MERHVPGWNVFRVKEEGTGARKREAVNMCASVTEGRVELRQSTANVLQLPILIAVAVLAMFVRQ
jgi:hypothetical protein